MNPAAQAIVAAADRRRDRSLKEKIEALPEIGEVEGFGDQLRKDGRMTPQLENLLALRMEQLRRNGGTR